MTFDYLRQGLIAAITHTIKTACKNNKLDRYNLIKSKYLILGEEIYMHSLIIAAN